jgi:hypothetical protein
VEGRKSRMGMFYGHPGSGDCTIEVYIIMKLRVSGCICGRNSGLSGQIIDGIMLAGCSQNFPS